MSRLTEKLPAIKQIKQIDYNYKSNISGGIMTVKKIIDIDKRWEKRHLVA